jgi:hypothetical protein
MKMRLGNVIFAVACLVVGGAQGAGNGLTDTSASPHVRLRGVDIGAVRWTEGFWAQRFEQCRKAAIPNMWRLLADPNISHAYDNFLVAAGEKEGRHHGPKWHDGDFYKWLEAVAFVYATTRDKDLDRQMDRIIETIGKAQREDGYLHTPVIIAQRQNGSQADEFQDRLDFETYNLGHLMTCACLHYRATGKTSLLDIAKKAADFLYARYRNSPQDLANNAICPSHYMGVVEMYRTLRDPRYLELAKGLIDIRDQVREGTDHNQDRIPFRQQTQAVGHAVRANYLYAGAADVYAETGDASLLRALEKIWCDVAYRKMYVTGATGALYDGASPDGSKSHSSIQLVHQAYGRPYQLPNLTAYNESCATVGFVLWNWRMLAITGEARFADLLELALYNGVLATISLDGKEFFYTNPLARVAELPFELRWSRRREPYISCFCCPPNTVRTIAEVGAYAYSLSDEGVWINLYGSNVLDTRLLDGTSINLRQQTEYPWDGTIQITVRNAPEREFSLFLRIPAWAEGVKVAIRPVARTPWRAGRAAALRSGAALAGAEGGSPSERGQDARDTQGQDALATLVTETPEPGQYFEIRRSWSAGDRVELILPLPVQLLEAHPLVEEARNQVVVRRGPIVYCLESVDLPQAVTRRGNPPWLPSEEGQARGPAPTGTLQTVAISSGTRFQNRFDRELLGGVVVLEGKAQALAGGDWDKALYREISSEGPTDLDIRLIPYYAWGNRGDSEMTVWLPLSRVGLAPPGLVRPEESVGQAGSPIATRRDWEPDPPCILDAGAFKHHVDFFNEMEPENIGNHVPNRDAWAWMVRNVPLFECPDKGFEQIYYFRWWTFRKHLKQTPDGFVFTEFLDKVGHSGKHNTISCALGHHIYEGSWLRDRRYLDEYARFWYLGHEGGLQPHFHRYSNWATWALYRRYLVTGDKTFLTGLLDAFLRDYEAWTQERGLENGLFWQYDVLDGMEESISGGRKVRNARPTLNSYMYANALAIAKVAEMAGRGELAAEYAQKASRLKSLVHELLWDKEAKFFKVRRPTGELADVREEIGFIPWYFDLPFVVGSPSRNPALGVPVTPSGVSRVAGVSPARAEGLRPSTRRRDARDTSSYALTGTLQTEQAWQQLLDPQGFKAPMGITTAERRHPQFRSHGVGTCEWDGAVWPFATSQTLVGLANVLRNYQQPYVSRADYFDTLLTYARSHQYRGKPYIGEYLDEQTGRWLKPDSDRSRYYNHSTFCDLVIAGLVGLISRADDTVMVDPLLPPDTWDWFCLDNVPYHGRTLTILWDRTGTKYHKGAGLRVFADGQEIARSDELTRIAGEL